jgi:pimeloyl-ACP methyl ester carboxylesterase
MTVSDGVSRWCCCTVRDSPAASGIRSSPIAAHRDVIAVDLPGHGDSPRQPDDRGNAPQHLAVAVAELLDELGLQRAHVAGSSQGGWVALELGRLQRALTVTCLSPTGLWRRGAPRYIRLSMRQARLHARIVRRLAPDAPRTRVARAVTMISASGHPLQLPYEPVHGTVHDMANAPGFRETLRALERTRFTDGADITVPVTVGFGTRDRVLLPGVARRRDQLPDHTRWVSLPGCGHVAMLDDPRSCGTCCSIPPTRTPPYASASPSGTERRPTNSDTGSEQRIG